VKNFVSAANHLADVPFQSYSTNRPMGLTMHSNVVPPQQVPAAFVPFQKGHIGPRLFVGIKVGYSDFPHNKYHLYWGDIGDIRYPPRTY
jgi:hypothetical protein